MVSPKHASVVRARQPEPNVGRSNESIQRVAVSAPANSVEEFASPPPQSPAAATTVEQPLPLMTAEMSLWRVGLTAFVLLPIATLTFAAAPLLIASSWFRRA